MARTGFLLIAVGFPVYLLWRGKLGAFLSLASGSAPAPAPVPSAQSGVRVQ